MLRSDLQSRIRWGKFRAKRGQHPMAVTAFGCAEADHNGGKSGLASTISSVPETSILSRSSGVTPIIAPWPSLNAITRSGW